MLLSSSMAQVKNQYNKMNSPTTIEDIEDNYEEEYEDVFVEPVVDGKKPSRTLQNQILVQSGEVNDVYNSEPIGGDNQSIPSHDTRKRIEMTSEYPYCSIGLVFTPFGTGTGCLVGRNIVLTCAHNCYNEKKKKKEEAKNLSFWPGLNGLEGEQFYVKNIYYCPQYEKEQPQALDFAILELKQNAGDKYGYLGLNFQGKKTKDSINIYGYPGYIFEKGQQKSVKNRMYGTSSTEYTIFAQDFIRYDLPTSHGQSGSPVYINRGQNFYVIGIHTQGLGPFNQGVLLKDKISNQINKWIGVHGVVDLKSSKIKIDTTSIISNLNIQRLRKLYLDYNNLTEKGVQYLWGSQYRNQIEVLSLSHNKIKKLSSKLGNYTQLKLLNVSFNDLSQICPEIGCLQHLAYFNISHNKIQELPSQLNKLDKLAILVINDNKLKGIQGFEHRFELRFDYDYQNNQPSILASPLKITKFDLFFDNRFLGELQDVQLRTLLQVLNHVKKYPQKVKSLCDKINQNLWAKRNKKKH